MKIVHIVENLDSRYGGPAKLVPLLTKYLDKLGVENKIFTIKEFDLESNPILDEYNYNIYKSKITKLKFLGKLRFSSGFKKTLEQEILNCKIVHIHGIWTYPIYCSYKLAKKYKLPYVVTINGMLYGWCLKQNELIKKVMMRLFVIEMLKSANLIHITEPNEEIALRNLGVNTECILVPNGIELENRYDKLDSATLQKIEFKEHKRYLMFLGRIVHNKGLHYLINSYKELKAKYRDIELLVVGGVEEQSYFDSLEKIQGVRFLGQLDGIEKHTIFSVSDLFILPSKSENFGISIAEAMSYKLLVITTTGTPWRELKEKNGGWWVDLNQENITKAIDEALSLTDKESMEKRNNGWKIVRNYTWEKQALKMKKSYEKIVKKG
jgi:glycosyltransferase involved in cell wall biosynthesis